MQKHDKILLAHGGGGQMSSELLRRTILPRLKNRILAQLADSAKLDLVSKSVCFTTDSYVVKPLFFNGGDIGKLAVCGTLNDLAVSGAIPAALSLSLIIEEGFEIKMLEKILASAAKTAAENDCHIVTGDTKVVEKGAADGIFINTAGIGTLIPGADLSIERIAAGDKVLINGTIGDHGMTVISQREGIRFRSALRSDCASVADLTGRLLRQRAGKVKFMRDPTRGGLAAVLNEIAAGTGLGIVVNQADIPIELKVQAAADMLGIDVLETANEGKFVAIISAQYAEDCIRTCKKHPLGKKTAIIGEIVKSSGRPAVEMKTRIGGRRIIQMPYGRQLPRIC